MEKAYIKAVDLLQIVPIIKPGAGITSQECFLILKIFICYFVQLELTSQCAVCDWLMNNQNIPEILLSDHSF